jgi:hypothetical protein
VAGPWQAAFAPVHGAPFSREFAQLTDLTTSPDAAVAGFAGHVTYRASFDSPPETPRAALTLDLGQVQGTAEVRLNGRSLGQRWWGQRRFALSGAILAGRNDLEIIVGTALFNYVRSLRDNPMARAWTEKASPDEPCGLLGPVQILVAPPSQP